MEKYRRNNIIEAKLQQLPGADVNNLWNGMHAVLDQAMPQQDKKRRFFAWLFNRKTLLVFAGISVLGITCGILFFKASPNPSLKSSLSTNHQNEGTDKNLNNTETLTKVTGNNPVSQNPFSKENATDRTPPAANPGFTAIHAKNKIHLSASQSASATMIDRVPFNEEKNNTFAVTAVADQFLQKTTEANSAGLYYSRFTSSVTEQKLFNERGVESSRISNESIAVNHTFFGVFKKDNDSLLMRRQKMIEAIRNRGVYFGVMAGFDLSTVRFNSFNPGSNKGVILGYSFNKKWSAEAGVYWNKKSFFGGAGTFDLGNYSPQPGVQIFSAKGDISLYEMPVSVRYSVLSGRNALFVTAGISSYFMKSENYKYNYEYNGQSGYSFFSPQNASKNWLSVANFSFGYNYKIGDLTSLRIEPYFKVPVKNIGFCNMPVMSTGINIGITRKISGL